MTAERIYSLEGKRVWVAGHAGMVGQALVRRLSKIDCEIITATRREVDLTDPSAVDAFVAATRPHAAFIAAAKVGGIVANDTYPADFLDINLMIAANTIRAAHAHGAEKLLFLGSSCIYPREAPQPITESALLTGPLEPTNEAYAIAKIAGVKLCAAYRRQFGADFISAMPTNLYGPGDNFDLTSSHVIPALIAKAHAARQAGERDLVIWGSGRQRREFLHVDDCADGAVFLMQHYSDAPPVNLGTGSDIEIRELARLIMDVAALDGEVVCDTSKPDGTLRKLLDVSVMKALGWRASIPLESGLAEVYAQFASAPDEARKV